jgi:hypothetical protein
LDFVDAVREVLGLRPLRGERYRSEAERFARVYPDPDRALLEVRFNSPGDASCNTPNR